MEKRDLKDYLVSRLISFGKTVDGYGKLYYKTNEDLIDQFLEYDFKDKDVFSVLASGDQVFTSRLLEAKRTDAFDYNRLAVHYFYLRLWSIEFKDELYPKILEGNNRWLISLLKCVKPRNEQEKKAYMFFKKHLLESTQMIHLFYDLECQPEGYTLFQKASELKDCLSPELDFYPIDLFEQNELSREYDYAIISNILEWARNDPKKLKIARDNLKRWLKKDGIVICSNLIYRDKKEMETETSIFQDSFEYEKCKSGYVYVKKN